MARVRERNGREGHKDDSHYQVTTQKRRKEEEKKHFVFYIKEHEKQVYTFARMYRERKPRPDGVGNCSYTPHPAEDEDGSQIQSQLSCVLKRAHTHFEYSLAAYSRE
ncbi:hypothetical protein EYF80_015301 [Liparis tanakae]|uniref:Uncharacterized protein n=1 Tax=Liparis tanakae TaxID=230148 RepID=A0A4Z2I9U7_9TELE|nr:hypothetical protein EYF80_015301 [Liparis tanakae]